MNTYSDEIGLVPNSTVIRVSGALSYKEGKQLIKLLVPLHKRMVLYALVVGIFIAFVKAVNPPFPFGRPVLLMLLLVGVGFVSSRVGRRTHQERRGIYADRTLEFDEMGVRVISGNVETSMPWSSISKVVNSGQLIVLFLAEPNHVIAVARSWCDTDQEWSRLWEYIQVYCPTD